MTYTLKGQHVLGALVGFFGVVFAVNGVFLVSALRTHTGVVAVEPYRKGLAYNDRIALSDAQIALGWHDTIAVDRSGVVVVTIAASNGEPVSQLRLTGRIGRAATETQDVRLTFSETASGQYRASTAELAPGSWVVEINAERGEADYRARRRLWLAQ